MAKNNKYNSFDDDWSDGPRERKDKPGKKHNNTKHQVDVTASDKKKTVKTPVKFRRHGDDEDED